MLNYKYGRLWFSNDVKRNIIWTICFGLLLLFTTFVYFLKIENSLFIIYDELWTNNHL